MINELIEQIGGRERLEEMFDFFGLPATHGENRLMARALLAVLDAPASSAPTAMQPLYIAGDGRIRFKENAIVRHLLTSAGKFGVDLNSIAMDDFNDDDRMQLAQLIGYSLGGYGELSYVSDESYNAAVEAAPVPGEK